ncbi:MAG: hypothetical protein Q9226_005225 [Calogaya cf. arnoldii]
MSINLSASPAHLRISENRFVLSPDTPVNPNAIGEAIAANRVPSPTEDRPHGMTAYPRPSYSPSSLIDNSPLVQVFNETDEEQEDAATPTASSWDPPKEPAYRFGPPPLEVANPDNDPEFTDAIFVSVREIYRPRRMRAKSEMNPKQTGKRMDHTELQKATHRLQILRNTKNMLRRNSWKPGEY